MGEDTLFSKIRPLMLRLLLPLGTSYHQILMEPVEGLASSFHIKKLFKKGRP
jgi:hypothetical protein